MNHVNNETVISAYLALVAHLQLPADSDSRSPMSENTKVLFGRFTVDLGQVKAPIVSEQAPLEEAVAQPAQAPALAPVSK